jgi:ABC-type antimicrobial peptide transport system permease subunit
VTPDYFDIVGVKLRQGRLFTAVDDAKNAAPVVILSDFAVQRYFEGRDPINTVIELNGSRTVVGVVSGIRLGGPESEVRPEAYIPMGQSPLGGGDLVIRTRVDPVSLVPAVKTAVWAAAPDLPITDAPTFESLFNRLIAQRKFTMLLIGLFGILAVVIAGVGIYGVMAYVVEQRTAEIGVRMALGAERNRILRMVLGRAAVFMAIGVTAGLLLSWLLASTISGFLFRVEPHDPLVYAAVSGTLAIVGLVAAFVPALRASRVDPLVALRN